MKCHTLRDAIVELARGGAAGAGTMAAIESHLEHCASCAALLTRERQLSQGLRALAEATAADGPSDALGRRLLDVFAERQAAASVTVVRATSQWTRAAAAVLVAGAAVAWWWGAGDESEIVHTPRTIAEAQQREPANTPTPALTPVVDGARSTPVVSRSGRPRGARRAGAPPAVRATGFVALPGADGLPDFESGQIIRLEIPLTSLPTYGIEIEPDAQGSSVEADVLVGQDGQARAIRLVTASSLR